MIARLAAIAVLLLANWVVWRPGGASGSFDLAALRSALQQRWSLREDRFPPSGLLPDEYLLLLADDAQPLLSVYVGYYATQGLAATGPHDPHDCYATQGWQVDAPTTRQLAVDGRPATVQTTTVQRGDERLLVTFWSQRPGSLPLAPAQQSVFGELAERWRSGRSDLAWVRMEWRQEMAEPGAAAQLDTALAGVIRAVRQAMP